MTQRISELSARIKLEMNAEQFVKDTRTFEKGAAVVTDGMRHLASGLLVPNSAFESLQSELSQTDQVMDNTALRVNDLVRQMSNLSQAMRGAASSRGMTADKLLDTTDLDIEVRGIIAPEENRTAEQVRATIGQIRSELDASIARHRQIEQELAQQNTLVARQAQLRKELKQVAKESGALIADTADDAQRLRLTERQIQLKKELKALEAQDPAGRASALQKEETQNLQRNKSLRADVVRLAKELSRIERDNVREQSRIQQVQNEEAARAFRMLQNRSNELRRQVEQQDRLAKTLLDMNRFDRGVQNIIDPSDRQSANELRNAMMQMRGELDVLVNRHAQIQRELAGEQLQIDQQIAMQTELNALIAKREELLNNGGSDAAVTRNLEDQARLRRELAGMPLDDSRAEELSELQARSLQEIKELREAILAVARQTVTEEKRQQKLQEEHSAELERQLKLQNDLEDRLRSAQRSAAQRLDAAINPDDIASTSVLERELELMQQRITDGKEAIQELGSAIRYEMDNIASTRVSEGEVVSEDSLGTIQRLRRELEEWEKDLNEASRRGTDIAKELRRRKLQEGDLPFPEPPPLPVPDDATHEQALDRVRTGHVDSAEDVLRYGKEIRRDLELQREARNRIHKILQSDADEYRRHSQALGEVINAERKIEELSDRRIAAQIRIRELTREVRDETAFEGQRNRAIEELERQHALLREINEDLRIVDEQRELALSDSSRDTFIEGLKEDLEREIKALETINHRVAELQGQQPETADDKIDHAQNLSAAKRLQASRRESIQQIRDELEMLEHLPQNEEERNALLDKRQKLQKRIEDLQQKELKNAEQLRNLEKKQQAAKTDIYELMGRLGDKDAARRRVSEQVNQNAKEFERLMRLAMQGTDMTADEAARLRKEFEKINTEANAAKQLSSVGGFNNFGFAVQQGAYALEDFSTQVERGLIPALGGAANNINTISATLGGPWAAVATTAVFATLQLGRAAGFFGQEAETADQKLNKLIDSMKETRDLQRELRQQRSVLIEIEMEPELNQLRDRFADTIDDLNDLTSKVGDSTRDVRLEAISNEIESIRTVGTWAQERVLALADVYKLFDEGMLSADMSPTQRIDKIKDAWLGDLWLENTERLRDLEAEMEALGGNLSEQERERLKLVRELRGELEAINLIAQRDATMASERLKMIQQEMTLLNAQRAATVAAAANRFPALQGLDVGTDTRRDAELNDLFQKRTTAANRLKAIQQEQVDLQKEMAGLEQSIAEGKATEEQVEQRINALAEQEKRLAIERAQLLETDEARAEQMRELLDQKREDVALEQQLVAAKQRIVDLDKERNRLIIEQRRRMQRDGAPDSQLAAEIERLKTQRENAVTSYRGLQNTAGDELGSADSTLAGRFTSMNEDLRHEREQLRVRKEITEQVEAAVAAGIINRQQGDARLAQLKRVLQIENDVRAATEKKAELEQRRGELRSELGEESNVPLNQFAERGSAEAQRVLAEAANEGRIRNETRPIVDELIAVTQAIEQQTAIIEGAETAKPQGVNLVPGSF